MKEQTTIQNHSTALVRGLTARSLSLKSLSHRLTKGELRELFVSNLLKQFLTKQFSVGSGIVVNSKGVQSNQTDIILYDNRVLPPFIQEQRLGVYPAESVLATIEGKSNLHKPDILLADEASKRLKESVYDPNASIYPKFGEMKPLSALFAFYGTGTKNLNDPSRGNLWLHKEVNAIRAICLLNKFSWITFDGKEWVPHFADKTNNETKRFIAILTDNIRTLSEKRMRVFSMGHRDWIGAYIRD